MLAIFAVLAATFGVIASASASRQAGPPTVTAACGAKPVTMQGYFETGFPTIVDLTKEFTRQYPNVKWKIRLDQFAVITQNAPLTLSGPNAPDLMRLPQISGLINDGLLKNLNGYFKAYRLGQVPGFAARLASCRTDGRPRGTGPLWAMGVNYSLTGVFYNKALAAKVGMTKPPATLAELDALLAKAKAAGVTPIVQFNGGATGGLLFPLQQLMAAYGQPGPINSWIFNKPGANINTPSNLAATQHLQQWIKAGYFNSDANATDYATMMSKFGNGDGLLIFDGDWESGNFDKTMLGNVGFFVMPPLKAGGKHAAMSAPLSYGIAAKAKHAGCAAFFLNWVATNPIARKINVTVGGSNPGGPPNLPIRQGQAGLDRPRRRLPLGRSSQRTTGRWTSSPMPPARSTRSPGRRPCRSCSPAQIEPADVLKTVQADYEKQVASGG